MSKILELRSKRKALWEQTKAFLEKNRGENGLVAADAVEQYNRMAKEVTDLGDEIERLEQQEQLDAAAQTVTMLIIDKRTMRLRDAGFPSIVLENTPKYLRRSKVPVVKAKVGPKIMTLMCDSKVYPLIPVKKEVKATVSGIYITAVRGLRGPLEAPPKKKGFIARLRDKI